ncbi:hypothetical protein KPH14_001337, partial [Odynerus spinipes]
MSQCRKTQPDTRGNNSKFSKNSKNNDWGLLSALMARTSEDDWYIDSGATNHMTKNKDWIQDFKGSAGERITVADNSNLMATGRGYVHVNLKTESKPKVISDVLHVPKLSTNLLSVSALTRKNLITVFDDLNCKVYLKDNCQIIGKPVVTGTNENGLYKLDTCRGNALVAVDNRQSHELWHKRLGHLNDRSMDLLQKGLATGIKFNNSDRKSCISCVMGKQTRLPFSHTGRQRACELLELLYADVCGPINDASWSGAKYIFVLVDDFSSMTFGYFMKNKSEVVKAFIEFKTW